MIGMVNPFNKSLLKKEENGYKDEEGNFFPVVNGVLRFVQEENYAGNFGFQWNKFQTTQIDREVKGNELSKERFFTETNWDKEDLTNKNVLEAGSGAGRFTRVVLDFTKSNLYSFDYSDAVSANYRNNGHYGNRLQLFQASIYDIPFPDNTFDKVFCFGVLQHTPDFKRSIKSLVDKTAPGGELIVDFYPINGWWTKLNAKYILRPFTKKLSHDSLLHLIEKNTSWLMKAYFFFDKIKVGKLLNRFLPLCDIRGTLPQNLSKKKLREWVILDTFDMFSPEHDHPQKLSTVINWFKEFDMEVTFAGVLTYGNNFKVTVVKGKKKQVCAV